MGKAGPSQFERLPPHLRQAALDVAHALLDMDEPPAGSKTPQAQRVTAHFMAAVRRAMHDRTGEASDGRQRPYLLWIAFWEGDRTGVGQATKVATMEVPEQHVGMQAAVEAIAAWIATMHEGGGRLSVEATVESLARRVSGARVRLSEDKVAQLRVNYTVSRPKIGLRGAAPEEHVQHWQAQVLLGRPEDRFVFDKAVEAAK